MRKRDDGSAAVPVLVQELRESTLEAAQVIDQPVQLLLTVLEAAVLLTHQFLSALCRP